MRKYYLNKIVLMLMSIVVVLISTRILMPLLFHEWYSQKEYLFQGFFKLTLLFLTIYFLKQEKIINWKYTHKNFVLTIIISILCIYFSLQHFFNKIDEFPKINISTFSHLSYVFNSLATGFFEEYFFRILIFSYVCKSVTISNTSYRKPVIWTSFLFAIVHITNFLTGNTDIVSSINQIMFAFLIGIVLQSLFFRFNNIFLTSILHATINYNGMMNSKLFKIESTSVNGSFFSELLQTLITFILVGLIVVLPIAFFSLRKRQNFLIDKVSSG